MSRNNEVGKGLLVGFLAGSLIGSVIALLFAPKTGRELRGDIKEKTDELMDDAQQYLAQAKEKASDLINEGKKKSEVLISDAKLKVDALLQDADKVLQNAREKAGDTLSAGKDGIERESDKLKTAFKAGMDAYKNEQKS